MCLRTFSNIELRDTAIHYASDLEVYFITRSSWRVYEHKTLLNYTYISWYFYICCMVQLSIFHGTFVKFLLFAFLFLWLEQMLKYHTIPARGRPCLFFMSLCQHTAQQKASLIVGPQQVPAKGISSPRLCQSLPS